MRLFFGLSLPPEAAKSTAALAARCRACLPGRYSLDTNYHITLAFIGHAEDDQLADARDALLSCAARFPAPTISLGSVSYFGKPDNAILVRAAQAQPDLSALHEDLCAALAARGLPFSPGPFTPHVTLARHASLGASAPESIPFSPVAFTAQSAHLYLSARDAQNILRYTPLYTAAFAPPSQNPSDDA